MRCSLLFTSHALSKHRYCHPDRDTVWPKAPGPTGPHPHSLHWLSESIPLHNKWKRTVKTVVMTENAGLNDGNVTRARIKLQTSNALVPSHSYGFTLGK